MSLFRHAPAIREWVVIDLETTGLRPTTDRIVEIGLVRLDENGQEVAAWTTLVDPERDPGPTRIHGLTARHLRGAPTFRDVAGDLLGLLANGTLVAHNARFDTAFLNAECARAGIQWGPISGLCTMATASSMRICASRSLADICEELGIALADHHTALADARATAALLRRLLPPRYELPVAAPQWPSSSTRCAVRLRTDSPVVRASRRVESLASRVAIPATTNNADPNAVISYFGLLDRVLEDRDLADDEVDALRFLASEWGINQETLEGLHRHYLENLWRLALADGVITAAERNDIETVTELLGVSLDLAPPPGMAQPAPLAPTKEPHTLVGKSVCFTGESICSIDGEPLDRAGQESLAQRAGLIVKSGVSSKLDILVLADPDSFSGKARRARELGVRRIAEPGFWRQIGVPID